MSSFPSTLQALLNLPIDVDQSIIARGWVLTHRGSKRVRFIALQDGSIERPLQVVVNPLLLEDALWRNCRTGAAIEVEGKLVASKGTDQPYELQAAAIRLLGSCAANYPLQPKKHGLPFLRSIPHLRFRTHTFRAVFRIRSWISQAIQHFLSEQGFHWVHTPLITTSDTEGAGELFELNSNATSSQYFFHQPTYLTVSGQLAGEAAVMGLGRIYTFGPTFRAENTHTTRHLSEFWMVEPEMAFFNLDDAMELAQRLLSYVAKEIANKACKELLFLQQRLDQAHAQPSLSLVARLEGLQQPYLRLTYEEALKLLQREVKEGKIHFHYPVDKWGVDLQTEHERYLTYYYKCPIIVYHYPKEIKAFYMKQNSDNRSVAAMDILVPYIGEIIGGSQREERLDHLLQALQEKKISIKEMDWYLDSRRFGSVIHSGFGLGLERLVQYITGIENIRDVIPFPRVPGPIVA